MDSTRCTLLLAMGAAFCAALISGWLMRMLVTGWLFWAILATVLLCAPAGLFAPWVCRREQRRHAIVPTVNIFSATVVSVGVSACLVFFDLRLRQEEQPGLPSGTDGHLIADHVLRTMIAVSGLGMAVSLIGFLVHYTALQESTELRRFWRRLLRMRWWAPKPKVLICEDLEAAAPGECAVCLDTLATASSALGLLRLPCGHTFHCECADRWMAREVNCPMCRRSIGSLSRCVRICLKPECCLVEAFAAEGKSPSRGSSSCEQGVEPRAAQKQVAAEDCHEINTVVDLETCSVAAGDHDAAGLAAAVDAARDGAAAAVAETQPARPGRQCFAAA